jgi:coatomer subunit beta'
VKIWDYKNRTCLQTLEHHENCVYSVMFHPEMPLLFSASEDGTV